MSLGEWEGRSPSDGEGPYLKPFSLFGFSPPPLEISLTLPEFARGTHKREGSCISTVSQLIDRRTLG